ncbi:MAG: 3-dehydroquinate synthase, partial [Cyanobacteria bacterium J06648_11]
STKAEKPYFTLTLQLVPGHMTKTTSAVRAFIDTFDSSYLVERELERALADICSSLELKTLLIALVESPAFSKELGDEFAAAHAIAGLSACRSLRSCLNLSLGRFVSLLAELVSAFDVEIGDRWTSLANRLHRSPLGQQKLLEQLKAGLEGAFYRQFAEELVESNPHAIYPTSNYRESRGFVVSTDDDRAIEAVMSTSTFASIKLVDHSLDPANPLLRDLYIAFGRCVCLIDHNVERYFGEQIEHYFDVHGIVLDKLVYRAMEVDKGIRTVEQMLGDFKRLGVSRNEPVLIVGGGVLADTGGLACALYHRNTPYVMLSTSIVSGIDAGPSPRTCCDGFGYKNLFGSYHPPVASITDRFFFKTLREGWMRHGIAEILKMATVKDAELFENMEKAGLRLIETRFGT